MTFAKARQVSGGVDAVGVFEGVHVGRFKPDGTANPHKSEGFCPHEVIDGALADAEFFGNLPFRQEVFPVRGRCVFGGLFHGVGGALNQPGF